MLHSQPAVHYFKSHSTAPGKACNAGGVTVSGFEISQNALGIRWSADEVNDKLFEIMQRIREKCIRNGENDSGKIDYVKGANITGFKKVADAMLACRPI